MKRVMITIVSLMITTMAFANAQGHFRGVVQGDSVIRVDTGVITIRGNAAKYMYDQLHPYQGQPVYGAQARDGAHYNCSKNYNLQLKRYYYSCRLKVKIGDSRRGVLVLDPDWFPDSELRSDY